jgi:hypothetical protein
MISLDFGHSSELEGEKEMDR